MKPGNAEQAGSGSTSECRKAFPAKAVMALKERNGQPAWERTEKVKL